MNPSIFEWKQEIFPANPDSVAGISTDSEIFKYASENIFRKLRETVTDN